MWHCHIGEHEGNQMMRPTGSAQPTFLGNIVDCHVTLDDGTRVRVQVDSGEILELGQRVCVRFDSRQSRVYSA